MEFPERVAVAGEGAVKTNDRKSLVFHPDAPDKTTLFGLRGCDVKYQCANFSQKLAPHVGKIVCRLIQAVGIGINHLQKALRQVVNANTEKPVYIREGLMQAAVFS